ncbi:MAG: peptide ABC transporter permease [Herpetosiphonaceae bacterium]|nr:MAG: peptide ABC transporter permease [Herpetosiphonaceae bacterium]
MIGAQPHLGFYVARRLLQAVPLVLGVLVITFVLIHVAPGDPITILAGDGGDAAYYEEMRARFGLDRPLPEQLVRYIAEVARGNFGYSFRYQQPVYNVVFAHVPATLLLMGTALLLSTSLGLLLGTLAALRSRSPLDHSITAGTSAIDAIPVFWLGQLLMLAFAVKLGVFPIQGMRSVRYDYTGIRGVLDILHHLALPALTLALAQLALIARLTRTSLRQVLAEDFIRTARAKGLAERMVLWRHALRNALLPIVTVIGGHIGVLLTGAALTETIFAWPGLGRLLLDSVLSRDYPLIMAIFILVSAMVVLANLLTDLIYTLLDPRVRYD